MSSNFTNTSTVTTAEAFKVDSRAGNNKAPSNLVVGIDTTTKTNSVCAATQGGARSLVFFKAPFKKVVGFSV